MYPANANLMNFKSITWLINHYEEQLSILGNLEQVFSGHDVNKELTYTYISPSWCQRTAELWIIKEMLESECYQRCWCRRIGELDAEELEPPSSSTIPLPVMRTCVNFFTVYNDTLVAKGLNTNKNQFLLPNTRMCWPQMPSPTLDDGRDRGLYPTFIQKNEPFGQAAVPSREKIQMEIFIIRYLYSDKASKASANYFPKQTTLSWTINKFMPKVTSKLKVKLLSSTWQVDNIILIYSKLLSMLSWCWLFALPWVRQPTGNILWKKWLDH